MTKYKIGIISGGAFGTTMALVISDSIIDKDMYDSKISILCHGEYFEDILIVDWFNKERINKKYLPGISLPTNLEATTNKKEVMDWDIVIFAIPHEYFINVCDDIEVKENACLISLTKGFLDFDLTTPSSFLRRKYNKSTFALMGANIALEIAKKELSDATLGYKKEDEKIAEEIILPIFTNNYFKAKKFDDLLGVELCGALKNVIAVIYGITEGLGLGSNILSAVFNEGIKETRLLLKKHNRNADIIFESCGIQDLFVTCLAGRNRKCGILLAKERRLGNFTSQGIGTCVDLYEYLVKLGCHSDFPIVNALHDILNEKEIDFKKVIYAIFKK